MQRLEVLTTHDLARQQKQKLELLRGVLTYFHHMTKETRADVLRGEINRISKAVEESQGRWRDQDAEPSNGSAPQDGELDTAMLTGINWSRPDSRRPRSARRAGQWSMTAPLRTAAWYPPDPDGCGGQSYWDGGGGTEHRSLAPRRPEPTLAVQPATVSEPLVEAALPPEHEAAEPTLSEKLVAVCDPVEPRPAQRSGGAHRAVELTPLPEEGSAEPPPALDDQTEKM